MMKVEVTKQHIIKFKYIAGILLLCSVFWVFSTYPFLKKYLLEYPGVFLVVVILGSAFFYGKKILDHKKISEKEIIIGIFLFSVFIRGMLIVIMPYSLGQHDVHFFGEWETNDLGSGHFGYIQYLIKYKQLPSFDPRYVWGFYNPPLHHIISAIWMKANHALGLDWEQCAENLQILTLFYSSLTIAVGYKIFREFNIEGKALYITFGVLAFHPIFAILSISVNNDSLSLLCIFITILFTVRWYKKPCFSNIMGIALSIGLGMMAKLSTGIIAPAVAFVFLLVLLKIKEKRKKLLLQFCGFGIVCVPLGMAWPVRLKLLFDMPFTYVQPLASGDMWQYVGEYNLWQRFGPSLLLPIFDNPWYTGKPSAQHNVWLEMFRTSILDEGTFYLAKKPYQVLASVLVMIAIIIGLLGAILFFRMLWKKNILEHGMRGFLFIGYVFFILSFIKFQVEYPYICTENFRYIVPTLLFSLLGVGQWIKENTEGKAARIIMAGHIIFSVLSCVLIVSYCLFFYQAGIQNI